MRLALDARTIYWPVRRGTGKNLIDLYTHVLALKPDWQVVAYHRLPGAPLPLLPPAAIPRLIEMPGDRFEAWRRLRLPLAAWRDRADFLHCPANLAPPWSAVPTVVTIHDLIPLDMPQAGGATERAGFRLAIQQSARRAAHIITPSRYTADRLAREFGADPARMTVNHWAPDSRMRRVPRGAQDHVLERYRLSRPFVLHFGAADPRKNTARLLEAWARVGRTRRGDWVLLVVGLDDRTRQALGHMVDTLGLGDSVRLHGFADESDLPALLSGAGILAYPSLSEGFGLPILDAWVAGTAVLTSNTTSIPEVVGPNGIAALMVDPADSGAIAWGLGQLMGDRISRAHLVVGGRQRVGQYTWANTAARFVGVVEQVVGASGRLGCRRAA
jgi:glycosyltransferase involved in cell wall biosynthesis